MKFILEMATRLKKAVLALHHRLQLLLLLSSPALFKLSSCAAGVPTTSATTAWRGSC